MRVEQLGDQVEIYASSHDAMLKGPDDVPKSWNDLFYRERVYLELVFLNFHSVYLV